MSILTKSKVFFLDLFLIFVFFSIKLILFNKLIDYPISGKLFLFMGISYMVFFIIVSSLFNDKLKTAIFLSIYSILSLIMMIDTVYFKKFKLLPSVTMLKQFSEVRDFSSIIFSLLSFKNILLIIDIIPLIIYFAFIRNNLLSHGNGSNIVNQRVKRIVQFSLIFIFIGTSLVTSIKSEGTHLSQEFFSYHIRDVYQVVFARSKVDVPEPYVADPTMNSDLKPDKYISHAGGRVKGLTYTNSKEAMDESYKNGYKLMELDMEWTTDDNLVLIHDWDGYVETAFGVGQKRYSTEEFMNFDMIEGLTQMSVDTLADWLRENEGIYIVTDIKKDNVKALQLISDRYPDLVDRFVPQIYRFDQYVGTRNAGYKNIILTLYISNYTDSEILDFADRYNLMAVTMPIDRAKTDLPKLLNDNGVYVYSHTINDLDLENELLPFSVNGFYTDDILPN